MANKTVTVKTSGGTYSSLSAAIAGEVSANPNLTAAGMNGILTIECYAMEDTTAVSVAGFTVDSTHYVRIVAADRHDGKWSTSAYRLVSTGSYVLDISNNFTQVIGLQIGANTTSAYCTAILYSEYNQNVGVVIDGCLIEKRAGGELAYDGINLGEYSTNAQIRNCLVRGINDVGIKGLTDNSSNYVQIANCTIASCGKGIFRSAGAYTKIVNCVAVNCTTSAFDVNGGAWHGDSDYNVSYDATAPGTNVATNKTSYTDYFVDPANGDYHLKGASGTVLGLSGVDLSGTFTTDIDNAARSGMWDVGADQYSGGGGAGAWVPRVVLIN